MNNDSKLTFVLAGLALVAALVGLLKPTQPVVAPQPLVGGTVHNVQETFDAGIAVDGTEVISSSRGVSAKTFTVVNGTATTSAVVGSSAIGTNRGQSCLWNGANYTITSFPSNSTTPTYATSTSC